MTAAAFYEKSSACFEANANTLHYSVGEKGTYFAVDKYSAYFLPGVTVWTVNPQSDHNVGAALERIFETAIRHGRLATVCTPTRCSLGKATRLENVDGYATVRDALLRRFPKNTLYYIQGHNKPVLAAIEEDNVLKPIGIVMPYVGE